MSYYQFHNTRISAITVAVPKNTLHADDLFRDFDKAEVDGFIGATGFQNVRRSLDLQTASDLGYAAASRIVIEKNLDVSTIGFVVFISKTPDYRSPATAAVLQHRLKLSKDCLAYDVNLGGVGFIAGIQLGSSLLKGLNTNLGLVIIGDTNSKQVDKNDLNLSHLGDGATAILFEKVEEVHPIQIQMHSEGKEFDKFMIRGGAFRTNQERMDYELSSDPSEGKFNKLIYDQSRFNDFYSDKIPQSVFDFLYKNGSKLSDFNKIYLQQANISLVHSIAEHLGLNKENIPLNFQKYGDVSGTSIPLLLIEGRDTLSSESIRILACAYGEGFSWGICDFYLDKEAILALIETDEYYEEGSVNHII